MPFSFSDSASPSSSASFVTPSSPLFRLPNVLLSHVCSYLTPIQLLGTLALTAKSTRLLLTPAYFAHSPLELGMFELQLLSSFGPPSSLGLQPFHTRVLSDCRMSVEVHRDVNAHQLLDALDFFPVCKTLRLHGRRPGLSHYQRMKVTDAELFGLLHLPATLSCTEFAIDRCARFAVSTPLDGE